MKISILTVLETCSAITSAIEASSNIPDVSAPIPQSEIPRISRVVLESKVSRTLEITLLIFNAKHAPGFLIALWKIRDRVGNRRIHASSVTKSAVTRGLFKSWRSKRRIRWKLEAMENISEERSLTKAHLRERKRDVAGQVPKNRPVCCRGSPDGLSCRVDFRFWTSDFMTDCDRPRDRRGTVKSLLSESFAVQTFCYLNAFFFPLLSLPERFPRFEAENGQRCMQRRCDLS